MTEPDYHRSTNKAYEVLNKLPTFSHITNIFEILNYFKKIKIQTYSDTAMCLEMSFDSFCECVSSDYGFSIKEPSSSKTLILYNDRKNITVIRFTLAHELGHYCLEHIEDGSCEDREANCFARNLLCPIPVATELDLNTVSDYAHFFNVSDLMAKVALDKRKCDLYNISDNNYSVLNDNMYCYFNCITLAELYGYSERRMYL